MSDPRRMTTAILVVAILTIIVALVAYFTAHSYSRPINPNRTAEAPPTTPPEHPPETPVATNPTVINAGPAPRIHPPGLDVTNPERLSPLLVKPFDAQAFADPAKRTEYLATVEPGRVFATHAPGPDVPVLRTPGPPGYSVGAGGTCTLTAITAPNAPVTFTSLNGGAFPNRLPSITVQADGHGQASSQFTAAPGFAGDVHLLVGSPMASGQVNFVVSVIPKTGTKVP